MNHRHDLQLRCRCGNVQGLIQNVTPETTTHAVCLCDDCQAYAAFLGTEGLLDVNGGTEITQVAHNCIRLLQGTNDVACVRLSPKGMHRWYARCCNTPLANTFGPKSVFAGVCHACVTTTTDGSPAETAVGPIRERVQGKFGKGELLPGTRPSASLPLILHAGKRLLHWWLTKAYTPSPFFVDGRPCVVPKVLSAEERRALG